MDDKFKNLSFRDFVTVDYTMTGDEFLAYQAQKRRRGHFDTFGESMDPRDFTDKPGYLVVVSKPSGKKMIKQYAPTSQDAQKYADRINKTNKVGHKATVHKTDGRKIMREEVEEVDEVMTQSQRIKKSQQMKRMSKRIQIAKKRALKKAPTQDVLMKRAQKQAKNQLIKKWTKGSKSDLSMGRRAEIEKRLKKSKSKIDRTAKRMLPDLRRQDRERRANANSSQKK